MKQVKSRIGGVSETMLQTLYARASESKKENPLFHDPKAEEIVASLNYDFSLASQDFAMSKGVIARTILLDQMVKAFIREHENTCIINIASGMDTRFYRLDNGKIIWYNIDLAEAIALRNDCFEACERVTNIACSAMDEKWRKAVHEDNRPVLVIIEGLTMYLTEQDVKKIFAIISTLPKATIYVETMSRFAVKHVKEKSVAQSGAKFTWGIKKGKDLEKLLKGFVMAKEVSLIEGMKVIYPAYKWISWIKPVGRISNQIIVLKNDAD